MGIVLNLDPSWIRSNVEATVANTWTVGATNRLANIFSTIHTASDGTNLGVFQVASSLVQVGAFSNVQFDLLQNNLVRWSVDTSGRLVQNATNGSSIFLNVTSTGVISGIGLTSGVVPTVVSSARGVPRFYAQNNASSGSDQMILTAVGANASGANLLFYKTRSTDGSASIVSNGDTLGSIQAHGSSATTLVQGAAINFVVAAAPGAGSMPTEIQLHTSTGAGSVKVQTVTKDGYIVPVDTAKDIGTTSLYYRAVYGTTFSITDGSRLAEIASVAGTGVRFWTTSNTDLVIGANSLPTWTFAAGGNLTQNSTNGNNFIMSTAGQGTTSLLLGASSLPASVTSAWGKPALFTAVDNTGADAQVFVGTGANAIGTHLYLAKTRASSSAATTAVAANDEIFYVRGYAAGGTTWRLSGGMQMVCTAFTSDNDLDTQLNFAARSNATITTGLSILPAGTPKTYLTTAGGAVPIIVTNAPSGTGVIQYINWNNNGTAGYVLFIPA